MVPNPSLDSVVADDFYYGPEATIKLNGFGATTKVYYQTRKWTDGVGYGPLSAWGCHDQATLAANGNQLKLALPQGRYQVQVTVIAREHLCDFSQFNNNFLVKSPVYTSNDFMMVGQGALADDGTTTYLTQNPGGQQGFAIQLRFETGLAY